MNNRKNFIDSLRAVAVPIIFQNLLFAMLGTTDTLMLNAAGQTALSSVALANQLSFVLNLFFMGLNSGTCIMIAQYLGKNDREAVNAIFRTAFQTSFLVSLIFCLTSLAAPSFIMRLFTDETGLIRTGSVYLRVVSVSYLFSAFSQIYLAALKAMGQVKKSAGVSALTLLLNAGLNAVLIFGLFGFPRLGAAGAALATAAARLTEFVICSADMYIRRSIKWTRLSVSALRRSFFRITCPITLQGFAWGGAAAVLNAIMGRMGSDAVAAYSVTCSIQNLATVVSFGFAEGGAILLGMIWGKIDY